MPPTSKKLKGQIGLGLFVCSAIYPPPPQPRPTPSLPPPPPPPKKRVEFFVKKNCRLKVMVTHEGQMIKWSLILSLSGTLLVHECIVMPPTSKKLKGQIGLGLFVCPSIYPSPRPPLNPPNPLPPPKKKKKKTHKNQFFF